MLARKASLNDDVLVRFFMMTSQNLERGDARAMRAPRGGGARRVDDFIVFDAVVARARRFGDHRRRRREEIHGV